MCVSSYIVLSARCLAKLSCKKCACAVIQTSIVNIGLRVTKKYTVFAICQCVTSSTHVRGFCHRDYRKQYSSAG